MNGIPAVSGGPTIDSQPPATNVRWRILALLLAYSFMSWFNRVSMSVAADEYLIDYYGISKTDMGIVYSTLLLSYAILMTPGGWFTDRFGAWTALVIMGFGSALLGALTGMLGWFVVLGSTLWAGLVVIRALMGVFTAPIYPASCRLVSSWLPFGERSKANGMIMGAAMVGASSTFLGFGWLIDEFGWERAFVITGAITAILGFSWMVYGRSYPGQHPSVNEAELQLIAANPNEPSRQQGASQSKGDVDAMTPKIASSASGQWLSLLRNRSLVLLTLSYAAVGYCEYLFDFWIHDYFEKELELGKDARIYATIVLLAMACGMIAGGWFSDRFIRSGGFRFGRAIVPAGGMAASALFVFLGLFVPEILWKVTFFSLALACLGASEGPFWATAIELGGRRGGTAAGIFNTGGNLGGLIAPIVTPMIGDTFGWSWAIAVGSIICLIGVVLWLWIDPSERCGEEAS
jgi:ACS family D-galactonate transporter-like MFS transporter